MRIHLLAVGRRMPTWIEAGYAEFARRLPPECRLELKEIEPGERGKGRDPARAMAEEGTRLLAALPKSAQVIALDEHGREWSSAELAQRLQAWLQDGRDVALLVGGADGLAPEVKARAETSWALSKLTLPHALVRVLVAEQLYRAWSILKNHPYHRV
jgi:23S rRNA (pseudouridine1915-N3)-methyltransferase